MRFWESSAIVPLLVAESQTATVFRLQQQDADAAIWWGAPIECVSAITRRVRDGHLQPAEEAHARSNLHSFVETATEVPATQIVRERAERLLNIHTLRAADALQLAAALV